MKRVYFWTGVSIVLIMAISYLITIPVESGANYIVNTRLLGIIIFYNPFILGLYLLLAGVLIFKGRKSPNQQV